MDTKRGLTEVARGSHDGAESRVANVSHPVVLPHSSDWLRHNVSHTQTQPPTSVAVPLVTPAALADMGHLYKLPTSATPSQPKIYSSGIFNPLYTLTSTTALQYSSYVSPSTVTYSLSCVTCPVSRVTYHISHVTFFIFVFLYFSFSYFFGQSGEAIWWRVCYHWDQPRLVIIGLLFSL